MHQKHTDAKGIGAGRILKEQQDMVAREMELVDIDDEELPTYRRSGRITSVTQSCCARSSDWRSLAEGFARFISQRVRVARRRHAKKQAAEDRIDAAVVIQRFYRLLRRRRHTRAVVASSAPRAQRLPLLGGAPSLARSAKIRWAWLESALLGSRPLEANIEHFHRAILRYITMLATLLLTALFSRPSAGHAAVNGLQCSAAATAVHAVLAMSFQRVEQMQSMAYLRRSKGIRNLRKRQRIASCYGGVAVAMEVLANIACAFGTYLVMLYWLKFGQRNQVEQLWWLAAACGATILNGVVWGRVRRAMSSVPSLKRCNADLVFVAVLCTTFVCLLSVKI